jgi:hypothetical protein
MVEYVIVCLIYSFVCNNSDGEVTLIVSSSNFLNVKE